MIECRPRNTREIFKRRLSETRATKNAFYHQRLCNAWVSYARSQPQCFSCTTYEDNITTPLHEPYYSSPSPGTTPTSSSSNPLNVLPSLKYTHSPSFPSSNPPSGASPPPVLLATQSYRFGPLTGLLSQICLLGGCLFKT